MKKTDATRMALLNGFNSGIISNTLIRLWDGRNLKVGFGQGYTSDCIKSLSDANLRHYELCKFQTYGLAVMAAICFLLLTTLGSNNSIHWGWCGVMFIISFILFLVLNHYYSDRPGVRSLEARREHVDRFIKDCYTLQACIGGAYLQGEAELKWLVRQKLVTIASTKLVLEAELPNSERNDELREEFKDLQTLAVRFGLASQDAGGYYDEARKSLEVSKV